MKQYDDGPSIAQFLGGIFLIGIVLIFINFIWRWQEGALEVVSVDNIKMLAAQANEMYEGLEAKIVSIQALEDELKSYTDLYGTDATNWPQGKRQEYQQLQQAIRNLTTSYSQDCAAYKAMWNNEWKDFAAPKDLPTYCETDFKKIDK